MSDTITVVVVQATQYELDERQYQYAKANGDLAALLATYDDPDSTTVLTEPGGTKVDLNDWNGSKYGQMEAPAPTVATKPVKPCPEGFHWIGQSIATCNECGLPAWEHEGMAVPGRPLSSPYDDPPMALKPWTPGELEEMRNRFAPATEADEHVSVAGEPR